MVTDLTDLCDTWDPGCRYSREVREDLTARALLDCFARNVLNWRTL